MTWVHLDVVLVYDAERLVRNLAVWFPMDYATIHLEIVLRLNRDTLEMTADLLVHGRNRNGHQFDDEPEIV